MLFAQYSLRLSSNWNTRTPLFEWFRILGISLLFACTCFVTGPQAIGQESDAKNQSEPGPTPAASTQEPQEDEGSKFKQADPPPVTRIVMFNSGLSQVIHEGTVDGNRKVNMRFSGHDVDDVLKSLVFEDKSDGIVRSVEYNPAPDNQDVAARNLGPAMTLAQTLQKYRGEVVVINTRDKTIKGSVLSVENRQTREAFVETLTIVNEEGFVSIPLNDFSSINFEDEKLREEFNLAMAGLKKTRLASSKELNLLFEGEGERNVRFSYNVDAPIWRMTYRLDLQPESSKLQGWAHIDNVTGVDWNDIQLDLRSGRPQSFHVDLFSPVLAERMGVGLNVFDIPNDKTLITKFFDNGGSNRVGGSSPSFGGFGGGGGGLGGGGFGGGGFGAPQRSGKSGVDINSAILAAAAMGRSNKMVRFEIKEPVSLAAGRSAMVPVLTESIPVQLYSMFNGSESASGARLVAQIKNGTTTPLIPGPVTLYQKGDFVGDGALNRIEVTQTEELAYGIDLAVSLEVEEAAVEKTVNSVELTESGDEVKVKSTFTFSNTYTFKNDDSIVRQFLLKIEISEKSIQPKPIRQEGDLGYYTFDCAARSSVEQEILQKRSVSKNMNLESITQKTIDQWEKEGASIADDLLAKMSQIFVARDEVKKIRDERSIVLSKIADIQREQTRVTEIIKVLSSDSPALETYVTKLGETETELKEIRTKLDEVEARLKVASEKLDKLQ